MALKMYLKFSKPNIASGLREPGHIDEIEILSWSHGFVQPASATRVATGFEPVEDASHSNFNFSKYPDAASAELLKFCWTGKLIEKALLSCYRTDGNKAVRYLEIEFTHVIVSNFTVSGGPGDMPVETISLDYGIVTYRYHQIAGATQVSNDRIKHLVS